MKILVVGGVAGGAGVCARLRRNSEQFQIIMFEKGEYISFANCGLPYYIGDVITDKCALQIQTPQGFGKRFNVDVRTFSEVVELDTTLKRVKVYNHQTQVEYWESYDKLILSPGAKPITPKFAGADLAHVFTLRNIPDTYKIKEFTDKQKTGTAVVIGGGYIGIEMAENLQHLGYQVQIVEANTHLIASIDLEVAAHLQNYLREQGLKLFLKSRVTEITPEFVCLENGEKIAADLVIMSIGVQADTGFLKNSGVALNALGQIIVDANLRTNVQDVYALGDAVEHLCFTGAKRNIPLASPANRQARLLADIICGSKQQYPGSQGTAILKAFDLVVAVTGESEESLQQNKINYLKSYTYSANHARYYPGASTMFIKLLYTPTGVVLGAQIVGGTGVDKRIDVLASAVRHQLTVQELTELELAYAPPFNSAKDPVNMAGYVAENVLLGKSKFFYPEDLARVQTTDILLDVRSKSEYQQGHLSAAINIPLDDLRGRIAELEPHKKIFIYCAVGLRGYIAQRILQQNGFIETYNLSGGYELYSVLASNK